MNQIQLAYPKPLRIPIGANRIPSKQYMPEKDLAYLLSGRVIVEEKMDGKFSFTFLGQFVLFAEDLKVRHSIAYRVPARFAIFDVFDTKREVFLDLDGKTQLVSELAARGHVLPDKWRGKVFQAPVLHNACVTAEELPLMVSESAYAFDPDTKRPALMEGIVVKPDRELLLPEHLSGKLVREEFEKGIALNYMKEKLVYNIVHPSFAALGRNLSH